jgi:hypothetical protein
MTISPPDAINEDLKAQTNAFADVEEFNSRPWQPEALDFTRAFRAGFPQWAQQYEQQAQADTNKPPFTKEAQAEISALATEVEKKQLELVKSELPQIQQECIKMLERIRELLPKDNNSQNNQNQNKDQNKDNQQNQNQDQNAQHTGHDPNCNFKHIVKQGAAIAASLLLAVGFLLGSLLPFGLQTLRFQPFCFQTLSLLTGSVHLQCGVQFFQFGFQIAQLLFVGIVFDQSHGHFSILRFFYSQDIIQELF